MFDTLTRLGSSAAGAYEIDKSLRFYSANSAKLTRTFGTNSSDTTKTLSFWMKRTKLGTYQKPFATTTSGYIESYIRINNDDTIQYEDRDSSSGSTDGRLVTNKVFRDTSAWYHIVLTIDTTNGTAGDRVRIYVNGVRETSFSSTTNPASSYSSQFFRSSADNFIGGGDSYFDGYLAEIHFIDGTALDASSFGETDATTGQWIPKKYSGSYGTNGVYLNFSDGSNTTAGTLGADSSGEGNNWTPSGMSVTNYSNDSMHDSPTNNYCTWNWNDKHRDHISLDDGALVPNQTNAGGFAGVRGTMGVTSGKWYFEFQCGSGTGHHIGWVNSEFNMLDTADVAITTAGTNGHGAVWDSRGFVYGWKDGDNTFYPTAGSAVTYGNNDIIGCAMDLDNYKFYFAKNNTWINSQDPTDGTNAIIPTGSNNDGDGAYSAGDIMKPYFSGWGNGTGETNFGQQGFNYTPPTGYQALCSANLSEPTIKNGTDYFDTVLFTGNGSNQSITSLNFQPDLVWFKSRNTTYDHEVFDSVRGAEERILTNTNTPEATDDDALTAFLSNGFTTGDDPGTNQSNQAIVTWSWKETASAGFDIVSYTGNGSARTISHNLGVIPEMIWVKCRSETQNWRVGHKDLSGGNWNYRLILDNTDDQQDSPDFNDTAPTSSVFSVGTDDAVNKNTGTYVAYLWASVEGYSKVGYYKGNGNANGPFVFTGFKPAMIIIKRIDAAEDWWIYDTKRDVDNPVTQILYVNAVTAEISATGDNVSLDIVSNGIKLRTANVNWNADDGTYIYLAFAETPFKYANAR